jgi:SAM-dependent methyltransferase
MKGFAKKVLKTLTEPWVRPYLRTLVEQEVDRAVEVRLQLKEFERAPEIKLASYWEKQFDGRNLADRFRSAGIRVQEMKIDLKEFEKWMAEYPMLLEFYENIGEAKIEKVLEHYLTFTILSVQPEDLLIDIAAAKSPFTEILRQKGMTAYRQDLKYAPGIRGYNIGGDAGNMPVPDDFADVLTLHCAFECFQGDADIRFAGDLYRVLRPGGRVGIVPLYVDMVHFVKTSPWCDKRYIAVEHDAKWLWRDDEWREPFSRHYSPEVFVRRITNQMPKMSKKILFFKNLDVLAERFEGQCFYCHFMFKGEKV